MLVVTLIFSRYVALSMKQFIILTLLVTSLFTSAVIGVVKAEEPDKLLEKRLGASSILAPAAKFMSGASALSIEGKDYRLRIDKDEAVRSQEFGGKSPILQAGAAAALVPFRSPTAKFSRNMLITRDLGGSPIQTEPHMAVDPLDPKHVVVGVIDYNAPNVVSYVSIDGGATWEGPFQPRYLAEDVGAGGDPVVAFDRNGKVYIASISIGVEEFSILGSPLAEMVSGIAVSRSDDGGFTWSAPAKSSRSEVYCIPVSCNRLEVTGEEGPIGRLAVGFIDKPWMTVGPDRKDSSKDAVYVTFTYFNVWYDIVPILQGSILTLQNPVIETTISLVKSEDDGKTWSKPIAISPTVRKTYTQAAEAGQFGQQDRVVQGSQPLVTKDGTVYVGWLDSTDDAPFKGLAEILITKSEDGGKTFSKPVVATNFLEPDFSSRTTFFRSWGGTFPQLATGPTGDISIVYVGRPAGRPTDDGDVYYVRSDDGGKTWIRPKRVNDDETVAFQFFPAVSVDPKGVVHIMWGDFRDDKSEKRFNIYYSRSEDGGKTLIENSRVTDFPTNPNLAFPQGAFIGDYFAIQAVQNDVYMVWADGRLGELGGYNQKIAFARSSSIRSSSIFITPPKGAGGKDVVLQGFDFQPDKEIFIEVSGVVVSSGRTDTDGKFSTRIFVPISGEGAHNIRVFDASGNVATASFYMDFGFDTIDNKLRSTVKDLQATLQVAPGGANATVTTNAILSQIESMQTTLGDRISAFEENVNSKTNLIWGIGAVAIVAILLSAYSIVATRRRGSVT